MTLLKPNMKKLFPLIILFVISEGMNSQAYISKKQAIEDLEFLNKTLLDVHFNPFLFVEKETFYSEHESLKKTLSDSVEIKDFFKAICRLTALIEDSHSSPGIYQAAIFGNEYKKEQFFPFKTIIHNNKLYISPESAIESGIAEGSEILSINKIDLNSFVIEVQNYLGGIPEYKREFTQRFLSHYLFLSNIKAPFEINYREPLGKNTSKKAVKGITYIQALRLNAPGLLEGNTFKIIDDKLGYIDFRSMSESWEDLGVFLDSAFVAFKEKNIQHLAIDLRNNAGGNSILGDFLLSYLTDKNFTLSGTKKWKISQQYKDVLIQNGNTAHQYLNHENGSVWEITSCEPSPNIFRNENKFNGKVYFLTGPFTFSSGNMIAAGVKQYSLAEILGQPTGENTNDFGEVYHFQLPNSKILMNITTSFDIGPGCDESITSPVVPDVIIEHSLNDLLQGKDNTLLYVLEKAK